MSEQGREVFALHIRSFLNEEGLLKQMPARHKMRVYVYCWMAAQLERGRVYTERELNGAIGLMMAYQDPASPRRALVDFGFMQREPDGSAYWLKDTRPSPEDLLRA